MGRGSHSAGADDREDDSTAVETRLDEKSGFSILVDDLEVPTLTGASQVVSAWKKWKQLEPLPAVQVVAAIREVGDRTFKNLATLQSVHDLQAVYSAIAILWFCPSQVEKTAFLRAIRASETAGFVTTRGDRGIKLQQHNVRVLEGLKGDEKMTDESIEASATNLDLKPKVTLLLHSQHQLCPEKNGDIVTSDRPSQDHSFRCICTFSLAAVFPVNVFQCDRTSVSKIKTLTNTAKKQFRLKHVNQ